MSFSTSRELSFTCICSILIIQYTFKENITYRYHIYDLSDEYNFYPTLHPKVNLIIQYKMFTSVYTGVHRKKRNQAIFFFYKILFYSCVFNELQDDTYRHMRFNTGETIRESGNLRLEPNILAYIVFLVSSYIRLFPEWKLIVWKLLRTERDHFCDLEFQILSVTTKYTVCP